MSELPALGAVGIWSSAFALAPADHVCLQPPPTRSDLFALHALRELAPALL